MKKPLKITLIVAGCVLGLWMLTSVVASPILKSYLLKNDKELIGREINVKSLWFNPLMGKVRIKGFTLFEDDGEQPFVDIDKFKTKIKLSDLLNHQVTAKRITFSGLKVNIEQNHDWFNYNSLREHFASDDTTSSESKYEIVLNNISIDKSQVRYADLARGSEFVFGNLSLKVPSINLSSMRTDVGLDLCLGDSTFLHTQVLLTQNAQDYMAKIQVENLNLEALEPYVKHSYEVDSLRGRADLDLQIRGNADHVIECDVKGNVIVHDLTLCDPEGHRLVAIDTVDAQIKRFNYLENYLDLKKLHLYGIHGNYTIRPNKVTNLDLVMKEDADTLDIEEEEGTQKPPLNLLIEDLRVDHSDITYLDQSMKDPFLYKIGDMVIVSKNLQLDGDNTLQLQASLNQVGRLNAVWKGNLSDLDNHNLSLNLSNVKFSDFSPYSVHYFGYPLEKGTLSFNSQNVITGGKINGINKLQIASPVVGNKVKGVEPQMGKIPLKTGIYLLTDKNQQLNLDVPIKGNLSDPEFSYTQAVMTVLGNLVVKVATSPFRILASDGDNPYLPFDMMRRDFSASEYSQIDNIAATLTEKPELEIVFDQQVDHENMIQELSNLQLKRDYYLSTHPGSESQTMDLLKSEAIRSIKLNDKGLCNFAEQQGKQNRVRSKKDVASVALAIYGKQSEDLLMLFLENKNELLRSYLTEKKGLDPERITVNLPDKNSLKNYKKESRYDIHLEFKSL